MTYRRDLYKTGRKHCTQCGRWRLVMDFGLDRRGTPSYLKSSCRTCERVEGRWRNAVARGHIRPYKPLVRATQHWTHCLHGHPFSGDNVHIDPDGYQVCRTCERKRRRTAAAREKHRIYQEAKRREAGVPMRPLTRPTPIGTNERLRVPVDPFIDWLHAHLPKEDRQHWAVAHETDDSTISKILSRKYGTVHIDIVDRVLRYEEESLMDLYPEIYEFEDELEMAA
jgi:hypothetical protein